MSLLTRRSLVALLVVSFFYLIGLVGHALPAFRPWMGALTPWFLLLCGGLLVSVYAWNSDGRSLFLWLLPLLVVTFVLEALGVATGLVFGPYHYTDVLGLLVVGVPPVIGWNWVLVVLGAHTGVQTLFRRGAPWVQVALVGLLCVLFDLILEPVAMSLGYWVWRDGTVPLQNYIAWGVIGAAGGWWAQRFPRLPSDPVLAWYGLLQVGFFFALGVLGVHS